jgi:hypothetical protein
MPCPPPVSRVIDRSGGDLALTPRLISAGVHDCSGDRVLISRHYSIPGNASASSAPEEPIDLNQALAEAASGSVTALMQLGRSGGEGAWFALAAAADEAGYDTLVEDLRKRSAEEDAAPYGLLSLSSLLSENPEVFPAPLRVLRAGGAPSSPLFD